MRVVTITRRGDPEVLQVQERPKPVLVPGSVRVAVRAAGVNFADLMARIGLYPDAPPLPAVVGYEVAGEVAELGQGVDGLAVGDRVWAATQFGGYAEQVVVPATDAVRLPDAMSFSEGAAIPANYGTAWAAMVGYGSLRADERVLIHGAAGGVGIAATQIALDIGAEVFGTASPGKHAALREQGVAHAVDYTRRGWEKQVPEFDLILDPIGGASFRRSYELLRPGGRLVAFGASSLMKNGRRGLLALARTAVRMPRFNAYTQLADSKTVIGLNIYTLWKDRGTLGPWIRPLAELIDRGVVKPVVAGEFGFEQAPDAHRMLAERRNVGKVVLTP